MFDLILVLHGISRENPEDTDNDGSALFYQQSHNRLKTQKDDQVCQEQ